MFAKSPTRSGRYGRRAINRSLFGMLGLLGTGYLLRQRSPHRFFLHVRARRPYGAA